MGFKCPRFIITPSEDEFVDKLATLNVYSRTKGSISCLRGTVIRLNAEGQEQETLVGPEWAGEGVCFTVEKGSAPLPEHDVLQMALHEWERDVFIPEHNHPASDTEKHEYVEQFLRGYFNDLIETRSDALKFATYSVVVDFERSRGYIGATTHAKAAEVMNLLAALLPQWADQESDWKNDADLMDFSGLMELSQAWLIAGAATEPWDLGRSCTIRGGLGEKILYDRSSLDLDSIRDYLESGADMRVAAIELKLLGEASGFGNDISAVVAKTGAISRFSSPVMENRKDDAHGIVSLCELGSIYLDELERITDAAAEASGETVAEEESA